MNTKYKTAHDLKTIKDFSSQWLTFPDNEGYFISLDLMLDSLAGLLSIEDFRDKRVLDLGSGTGIVKFSINSICNEAFIFRIFERKYF